MERKFYKGGAPEKPEEEKRERFVQVRFTVDEFTLLEQRRKKTMARYMSCFIRSVCLEKPLLMRTQMETYQDIALSLIREMRSDVLRIGVNINQSSRRINSTTDYQDLQREITQMTTQMSQLDARLRAVMSAVTGQESLNSIGHDNPNQ